MELDGYKYFRDEPPTIMGKRIELIIFSNSINPVRSFHEYTGTLERVLAGSVIFVQDSLFHRVVTLDRATQREPSTQFTIVFNPLFYQYKWRYIDGDEPKTAIEVSSPTKAGKSRKRKRRKTRRTRN